MRALILGVLVAAAGCFSPDQPACQFSCALPPHACPANYVCRADNYCHRKDSTGLCMGFPLSEAGTPDAHPDAHPDASMPDAPIDALVVDASDD